VSPFGAFPTSGEAPAYVTSRSLLVHTLGVSATSIDAHAPQRGLENELSTTPDTSNGEQSFIITHPFHPLSGQTFPLLSQRFAWGEERVFFLDPQTQQIRSLPLAWTNLALPDPFVVVAQGKAVLRWSDLHQLAQFLSNEQTHSEEGH
jgi:hypothetical protein